MKISEETVTILKNFSVICSQILIKPGFELRTGTVNDTLQAKATIKENFPREFAIYDIAKFLSVLSLFKDPELEFAANQIVISQESQSVHYTYASPNMVYTPLGEPALVEHVVFSISSDILTGVSKAMNVLQQSEIAIIGDKKSGEISFETVSVKNSTADSYRVVVAEQPLEHDFRAIIKADNYKFLPRDYTVVQDLRGMTSFKSEDLIYVVANEQTSKLPEL